MPHLFVNEESVVVFFEQITMELHKVLDHQNRTDMSTLTFPIQEWGNYVLL